jgi:2-polyprenyl-3-methyl-5-hydroxy-6-metoxy-1,4-benzoquinol methylase
MERQDWNRKHGESGLLFGAEPNRFLVSEVSGMAPGRALDLACGSGRNAVWLAQQGWSVLGADFADVALGQAAELAAERGVAVEWVDADLQTWQPPGEFDLIAVLYLQLPAEELDPIMRRAAAALAPGGTLLVVGHHSRNLEEGSGGPKDPRVLFTPEQIAASLDGLEIEKAEAVWRDDAIDALVRARRPGLP